MIRFCFRLLPLESLPNEWKKSWPSLTDGWFWLESDGQNFFRYSEYQMTQWERESDIRAYPAYPVSRLWEDILEILEFILTPIPKDIITQLSELMQ